MLRYTHLLLSSALALGALASVPVALAGDNSSNNNNDKTATEKHHEKQQVQLEDLPTPAADTVRREAEGGKLLRIDELKRNGETVYGVLEVASFLSPSRDLDAELRGPLLGQRSAPSQCGPRTDLLPRQTESRGARSGGTDVKSCRGSHCGLDPMQARVPSVCVRRGEDLTE